MRFCYSILLIMLFSVSASAQSTKYGPYFNIGFGGTSYRGDLTNKFESWGGTFHAGILLNKKKRMNGYIHLMIGGVQGENPDYASEKTPSSTPNKYFRTSFLSLGYELRINIVKRDFYNVYISPGFGILRYNPKDEYKNSYSDQFNTRAKDETYSNVTVMLPINIGGNYFLESGYGIGATFGFLNPMTDYMDNISQLGNRSKKDNLMQMNLMLYIPLKKHE